LLEKIALSNYGQHKLHHGEYMKFTNKEFHFLVFLCLALLFLLSDCSSDKNFKFTYSRKDGEIYVQKLSTSRERHTGADGIEEEETLIETKVTCKKTKDGWKIESQPVKTIMLKNGEAVKSPLLAMLSKFVITYQLDNSGIIEDVLGYDRVLEAANSQSSPEVAENLSKTVNIEAIKQREITEWKGSIGDFLDKNFSIGDTWEHDTIYTLPNGVKISYRVKTHFKEKVQQNNVTCVLIEQTYDSAGQGQTDGGGKHPKQDQGSASIKGAVTRIIDPATMRIYREEVKRIIHMEKEMPVSGKVPVEIVETRTYEYEYGR
jgi:hypothetical protein